MVGVLHCDPHPGNLFITPEGNLCILDWGLVTRLDSNIQATFLNHIAHLTSKDYKKVPGDLVKLGFIAPGKEQVTEEAGVVQVLDAVYTKLAGGGGAKKVNIPGVVDELNSLSEKYGNLFRLPAYFAYIARAFGVLEGIGLTYNPDYAIITECLPYVSQRMLADTSPETGAALTNFIFGAEADSPHRVINPQRFELLLSGYGKYASSSMTPSSSTLAMANGEGTMVADAVVSTEVRGGHSAAVSSADALIDTLLTLLVSDEVTPLQAIVVEELAKVLSSAARDQFESLKQRSGRLPNGRSLLGTLLDPLDLLPVSDVLAKDKDDERVLESTASLVAALRQSTPMDNNLFDNLTPSERQELLRQVTTKLLARRREIFKLTTRVSTAMLRQNLERLERKDFLGLRFLRSFSPSSATTV